MAGTTGLEPATSAVTGQRSNQLNYVPAEPHLFANCGPATFPTGSGRSNQLNYVPAECSRMVGSVRFERTTFRV